MPLSPQFESSSIMFNQKTCANLSLCAEQFSFDSSSCDRWCGGEHFDFWGYDNGWLDRFFVQ
jgi:hypothetical protein